MKYYRNIKLKNVMIAAASLFIIGSVVANLLWPPMTVRAQHAFVSINDIINVKVSNIPVGEIVEERTRFTRTSYLGDTSYGLDSSLSPINYQDGQGDWQQIDNGFYTDVMDGDEYITTILQSLFDSGELIEVSRSGESVKLQPMMLEWTNDLRQFSSIAEPEPVGNAIYNNESYLLPDVPNLLGTVTWPEAYGVGSSFQWQCTPGRLSKKLVIDSAAFIPEPPQYILDGGNPVMRLSIIFAPSKNIDIYVDGQLWDEKNKIQTFDYIDFKVGSDILWSFRPLHYWDSARGSGIAQATLDKSGPSLYIGINIPYNWLQTATFPIYIDADVDVQVGADNDDGYVYWSGATGKFSRSENSDYWASYNYDYNDQSPWAAFGGITIPAGQQIDVAYASWYFSSIDSDAADTTIYFVDEASPAAPGNYSQWESDPKTANSVVWALPTSTGWQNTDDVSDIVQELYDDYGPYSGGDMVIETWCDGTDDSTERASTSHDGNNSLAAKLHIEYSAAASDPEIGISPASYDFGTVTASANSSSATDHFTLSNNSTMQTDITIGMVSANWTGGNGWGHSDTATPDTDIAGMLANRGGSWGTGDVIVKYNSPNYIYENCPATTAFDFGLMLIAPTEFTDGVEKENTVRITAVAG